MQSIWRKEDARATAFSDEDLLSVWHALLESIKDGAFIWTDVMHTDPEDEFTYDDWGEILYNQISLRNLPHVRQIDPRFEEAMGT